MFKDVRLIVVDTSCSCAVGVRTKLPSVAGLVQVEAKGDSLPGDKKGDAAAGDVLVLGVPYAWKPVDHCRSSAVIGFSDVFGLGT